MADLPVTSSEGPRGPNRRWVILAGATVAAAAAAVVALVSTHGAMDTQVPTAPAGGVLSAASSGDAPATEACWARPPMP